MNDEQFSLPEESPALAESGDPVPEEVQEIPAACELPEEESTSRDDPGVTGAPAEADAPEPVEEPPENPADETERLRDEVGRLRRELAEREAYFARVEKECAEFRTLYPDTPLSSLPASVWEDVRNGIPVSAAYALTERRRALIEEIAAKSNRQNDERSAGALVNPENDFYSPAEVRAMSQSEVRANYDKILRSMPKWH